MIPVDRSSRGWRAAALERVIAVDARLAPLVADMRCTVNGREVKYDFQTAEPQDVTLRWRCGGVADAAPKASEFADMRKAERMAAAKALGVETRRAGTDGEKKTVASNGGCASRLSGGDSGWAS